MPCPYVRIWLTYDPAPYHIIILINHHALAAGDGFAGFIEGDVEDAVGIGVACGGSAVVFVADLDDEPTWIVEIGVLLEVDVVGRER